MRWIENVWLWLLDDVQGFKRWGVWGLSFALGWSACSPWWWEAWQNWQIAKEAETLAQAQWDEAQDLQRQVEQIWAAHSPMTFTPDAQRVTASLASHALVVTDIGLERAWVDPKMADLQVAQVPVRLGFEGDWQHWQDWVQRLPNQLQGATITALDIRPAHEGRVTAKATLSMPQLGGEEASWQLASLEQADSPSSFLIDAKFWQATQQAHAQNHSAMPIHLTGAHRVKDPLEFFNRAQLQYVGMMGWGEASQALIRVNDPRAMTSVYRVAVGGYVGKDAGRVRAIDMDCLVIDEWVKDAAGQWRSQEVRMPLWLGAAR